MLCMLFVWQIDSYIIFKRRTIRKGSGGLGDGRTCVLVEVDGWSSLNPVLLTTIYQGGSYGDPNDDLIWKDINYYESMLLKARPDEPQQVGLIKKSYKDNLQRII